MNDPARAEALIRILDLQPHPEGGFYRETFRSDVVQAGPHGARAASTAIWFLLCAGQVSRWHRVLSDECWHWYEGASLDLLQCDGEDRPVDVQRLGPVAGSSRPQVVVPAGRWQAAIPRGDHVLVGCTVAPGFDFADFTLIGSATPLAAWLRSQAEPRLVDG